MFDGGVGISREKKTMSNVTGIGIISHNAIAQDASGTSAPDTQWMIDGGVEQCRGVGEAGG